MHVEIYINFFILLVALVDVVVSPRDKLPRPSKGGSKELNRLQALLGQETVLEMAKKKQEKYSPRLSRKTRESSSSLQQRAPPK